MSFAVKPAVVEAAGDDMVALGDTVSTAASIVRTHVQVDPAGTLISHVSDAIDGIRADLLDAYGPGGEAERLFNNAGYALRSISRDYEDTDQAQAAEFDGLLKEVDEDVSVPRTSEAPGVDEWAYGEILCTMPESAFEDYDEFTEIRENVDYIVGFDWIGDALGGLGLPDPLAGFKDKLEGDWSQLGTALGGLELVKSYWHLVLDDLDATGSRFGGGGWSGNAAEATLAWMDKVDEALGDHIKGIDKTITRVKAEGLAMKSALTTCTDIIDTIVGLIPDPSSGLTDFFTDLFDNLVKGVLTKLLYWIELFTTAFNLALTAAHAIVAGFAQLTRFHSHDFPDIPQFSAPDVNGPAA